jgi:flagellar protein FlgJ
MSLDPRQTSVYTDFSGLTQLKAAARADSKGATEQVARQFETIFTQMMLKSMRSASLGEGALDSDQTRAYRDMFDQQMAVTLASRGKGLGIADMLVRQLGGDAQAASGATGKAFPIGAVGAGVSGSGEGFPVPSRPLPMSLLASVGGNAQSLATRALDAMQRTLQPVRERIGEAADAAARQLADGRLPSNPVEFVESLLPHAQAAAEKLGVSVRALLAHAALETGWGKHLPKRGDGVSSFNLFGIKAGSSWGGAKVTVPTLEVENGVTVRRREAFRAYASPADSFMDYAELIGGNPRYAKALGHGDDVRGFARALQSAGYATDPHYANKLDRVADSEPMRAALDALDKRQHAVQEALMPKLQLDTLDSLKISDLLPSA